VILVISLSAINLITRVNITTTLYFYASRSNLSSNLERLHRRKLW